MQTELRAKEFYFRKRKKISDLLPVTFFTLFCWSICILFINEFIIHNPLNDMVDFIIGFMGMTLGFITLWSTYFLIYKALFFYKTQSSKEPAVMLSKEGIAIRDIIMGEVTMIEWQEIQFFLPYGFTDKPYAISIALYDPKMFIAKEKNLLKKIFLKRSISKYKAPYVVFPERLDTEENIYNLLNVYLQNERMKTSLVASV